jgi:hypothetical protein
MILCLGFACQRDGAEQTTNNEQTPLFTLADEPNPELVYEQLRILPVLASEAFIKNNEPLANYQSLKEAIDDERFRIVEKKPYGRFTDAGAVNTLTVMNKSEEPVFLMAGEVVQGGNQDRVLAQDMLIPPATITDIPVFCVEKGRWTPRDQELEESSSKNKRAIAFNGYYNVAASDIRRTVKHSKNQQEVWKKVGQVTSLHNATVETGTYAALEGSDSYTQSRNAYLQFFADKFQQDNIVGMVAVSGNRILGADIFGHPDLFKKSYEALLHSYITEAISKGGQATASAEALELYEASMLKAFHQSEKDPDQRYEFDGKMIHFTHLP